MDSASATAGAPPTDKPGRSDAEVSRVAGQAAVTPVIPPGTPAPSAPQAKPEEKSAAPVTRPEKFKTDEDVYKAYNSLEEEHGKLRAEMEKLKQTPPPPAGTPNEPLNWDAFEKELNETGALSKETLEKYGKAVEPKHLEKLVAIQKQAAQDRGQRNEMYLRQTWGENADSISEWIKTLPENKQKEIYGKLMDPTMEGLKLATDEVTALYSIQNGFRGQLMHGTPGDKGMEGYKSDTDPEFIADTRRLLHDPNNKDLKEKIDKKVNAMHAARRRSG